MNWSGERYVRIYTRDTADWMALSFDAQGLFCLLLRKLDRSGKLALGRHGKKAVAVVLGQVAIWNRLEPALEELLADGCVHIEGETLMVRNFVAAQESIASGAARTQKWREQKGANGHGDETSPRGDGTSAERDEKPGGVTGGDSVPCRAVPSLAVPSQKKTNATPDRATALAGLYPATAALIEASEGKYAFPSKSDTRAAVEAAIKALPLDEALKAAEACFARTGKRHLGWALDDLSAASAKPPERHLYVIDLAWIGLLPPHRRPEAEQAWKAKQAEVESCFRQDAWQRVLSSAAELLRKEFDQ